MNTAVTELHAADQSKALERVLLAGDLSRLSTEDRLFYYQQVCQSVGLNPLTRPFDYLTLNGRQVLYAKRDATDQLRKIHGVSVNITDRSTTEGVYVVTAKARDKSGREDESTGAVTIKGLTGDHLANALMKAETKAKRRVTLSICGLGMLDETEIETIPAAAKAAQIEPRGELGRQQDPKVYMEAADKMRAILEADAEEDAICARVMDMHDELRIQHDTYVGASDCLSSKERATWKKYVKLGHDKERAEPPGH